MLTVDKNGDHNFHSLSPHPLFSSQKDVLIDLMLLIEYGPLPVTVTTRTITFLVGNPYKPSFATVTGRGPHLARVFQCHPLITQIFLVTF